MIDNISHKKLLEQKERAEHASALKTAFLANVTHELKTPVHCIINFAQIGAMICDKNNNEELKEYFDDILFNGRRLDALVSDLLDLSKIEAGMIDFNMDMYQVSSLIKNAVAVTRGLSVKKRLIVEVVDSEQKDEYILVDAKRMEQVLINLISNAIRFTPKGGKIEWFVLPATMKIGEGSTSIPALIIRIENEGPNIPEDELEKIFEHFVQGKDSIVAGEGTGLGLTICRQFLQPFHGTIRALNPATNKVAFEITLPLWQHLLQHS